MVAVDPMNRATNKHRQPRGTDVQEIGIEGGSAPPVSTNDLMYKVYILCFFEFCSVGSFPTIDIISVYTWYSNNRPINY